MNWSRWLGLLLVLCLIPALVQARPERKKIVLLIGAGDSLNLMRALKSLNTNPLVAKGYAFDLITDQELRSGKVGGNPLAEADIVLVDFMKREFIEYLSTGLNNSKTRIYSLRCAYLADRLKEKGLDLDASTEKYCSPSTSENYKNLLLMVLSRQGERVTFDPPFTLPTDGIFHPNAPEIFTNFDSYLEWSKKNGHFNPKGFWVGISTFSSSASATFLKESGKIEAGLIMALEQRGMNVLPVFGRPPYHQSLEKYFIDQTGHSRVQALCGFSFRFLRGFSEETEQVLTKIDAPIFIPLEAHSLTISQWEKSEVGISPLRTAWQVCIPEQNGGIEPTVIGGKTAARLKDMSGIVYERVPLSEGIDFLIKRIQAWHALRFKANRDKKIAILYWNHPPGKQGIGASYLNCFRSLATILDLMKKEGYSIEGGSWSDEDIKDLIMASGRNVGSWAPGELEKMVAGGKVVRIPIPVYKKWFETLPLDFQEKVTGQWGRPEDSDIMIHNGDIIIPMIDMGHVILLPQPSRGFGEDTAKLYHDPKVYPHHQYIAFYLWLKNEFRADAIVSLGKHGTHEWLPGKQVGLSRSCPPEVLLQDIPNIYPYIVDNVGEGIQAKRRGRGVIIDHLIPPLKKGDIYMEYRELTGVIDDYRKALAKDAALAALKLKTCADLIFKMGLDRDLGFSELNEETLKKVEHYLLELQESMIPYGLHTLGRSPSGQALADLTGAILAASPEIEPGVMKARLEACGPMEIKSLLEALQGRYIPAGPGNDPVRNPLAVPTGRNFYGFNIDKVPSREAFAMGKKMADGLIRDYREKHRTYPDKMGIILWSTELQRNEGASVAAALHLLGITPVWDAKEQVVDLEPIPGAILKRPRIDVLLQASGLFRDSYAQLIKLLDRAVRLAGSLKDVENFVAINNKKLEKILIENGYPEKEAVNLSQLRLFAPMPGAYSHALQELIPNSGAWEDDQEISDVFIHHYSFAYGQDIWGKPLKSAYKGNLKDVKVTVHTRSSNLYNMLDNDDMFAFLGGLSLAVKSQTGEYPETLVANLQDGKNLKVEELAQALGKALRTRYLNPKWIEGMKREGYAGAKHMDEFVEYLWGFQVTSPLAVDETFWREIHDVYMVDKYDLGLKEFFDKNNPWARQSMAARMLEADRKKYWRAPEEMKKNLARTFAVSVMEKGLACCEHTCNNPMLHRFVANIVSLHGLLTPEQLERFKMVISKAIGQTQEEKETEYKKIREGLQKTLEDIRRNEKVEPGQEDKNIKGFEMVEEKNEDAQVTASGSEWMVMVLVLAFLGLLFSGWIRKRF